MYQVENVFRNATHKENDRLNLITFNQCNEKYICMLAELNCDIYLWNDGYESKWNESVTKKPKNVISLGPQAQIHHIPCWDAVVVHDRFEQYAIGFNTSKFYNIPLILVDHTTKELLKPIPILSETKINTTVENVDMQNVHQMRVCSEKLDTWSSPSLRVNINQLINSEDHKPNETATTVCIDNCIPNEVANALFPYISEFNVIGCDGYEGVPYKESQIFINTWQNITTKCLEAMSYSNVVISFVTPDTQKYFNNMEDGILVENLEQLKAVLNNLLKDNSLRNKIGTNARNRVIVENKPEDFITKWQKTLNFVTQQPYIRGI